MAHLEDWRAFVTVAQLRSFAGAARALGRSPQAVTRAVAALEARVGARLLHRTTRAVSLTGDGERYVEQARRVLADFDALESRAPPDAPLAGALAVTAPVLLGQLHVVPAVTAFLARHAGLAVRLALLDRVVSLAEEGIDVGVRVGELADSSLAALRVGEVRTVACASPAYLARAGVPASPEELARHACVAFTATTPAPDRWTFPREGARDRTVAVRPRLVVNTGQAAIDAALAGVGVARVMSYQVARHVRDGALRVVLERFEPRPSPVHLVRLPGSRARAAQAFAEFAAENLRRALAGGAAGEGARRRARPRVT